MSRLAACRAIFPALSPPHRDHRHLQGIGLDAAKRLIRDGHTVYHANRNGALRRSRQQAGSAAPMVCDLASLSR